MLVPHPSPFLRAGSDEIVVVRGSWKRYEQMLANRGERSAPRISFLDGEIEIVSPGLHHEGIKGTLGCLVEVWCDVRKIEFQKYGSWTLQSRSRKGGVEPDECYVFGFDESPERPDLAIEVIWTSGGLDKLEIYRRLGVREVWIWKDGGLTAWALERRGYRQIRRSRVLRGIGLATLASCVVSTRSTSTAIRAYRTALRRARRAKK